MDMIGDRSTVAGTATFRHAALFYAGPDAFLEGAVPFVRGGLEAEEPILVMIDPAMIGEAHRSHPTIVEGGAAHDSDEYHGIDVATAPFAHPLTEAPAGAAALVFTRGTLDSLRHFVAEHAERAGLDFARSADLM